MGRSAPLDWPRLVTVELARCFLLGANSEMGVAGVPGAEWVQIPSPARPIPT